MGKWTLAAEGIAKVRSLSFCPDPRPDPSAFFKTTAMTACGNFGLVGSTNGEVLMYNMQSGKKRKVFKVPSGGVSDVKGRHVTGIASDSLNRMVIVSTLKGGLHVGPYLLSLSVHPR